MTFVSAAQPIDFTEVQRDIRAPFRQMYATVDGDNKVTGWSADEEMCNACCLPGERVVEVPRLTPVAINELPDNGDTK